MLSRTRVVVIVAAVAVAAVHTSAQPARGARLLAVEDYLNYETVADPQISPDGTQIVYTRRVVNQIDDRMDASLWIMNPDGSRNRFLTKGSSAVWSPDGTRIAYIANGEPKGSQVFVRWIGENSATQITHVEHAPANLKWSPDGRQIAIT